MAYTTNPQGQPGVLNNLVSQPRSILYAGFEFAQYVSVPIVLDGLTSQWAANTPYTWLLPAGMLFGRETTSGKYAPSILGQNTLPIGGSQTSMTMSAATAAYIASRIGTSGTFSIAGPPTPSGVVTSQVVTYSAINTTTGVATITALGTGAVSAVNQINSLVTVDSTGSGTFTLTVEGITTAAITYSATAATLVTNINAQLNATFGTSAIVASGSSLAAIILTFSGTGYAARPVGTVQATILTGSTGYTLNGSGTIGVPSTCPVTTAGVTAVAAQGGEYIAGALIQPNDGSQLIRYILAEDQGIVVIDPVFNKIDAQTGQMLSAGGTINTGFIVNYPTDPSLQNYIKAALALRNPGFSFLDDQAP